MMKTVKKSDMINAVKKFKNKKVLVVGDMMIDEYIWGKVSRISPEAPIPVVDVQKEESKPGGAANVILNLVSLGAKVYAAGVIGRDLNAHKLLTKLEKMEVNITAVIPDNARPTTIKTRVIAHNQQVVRIDKEHRHNISPAVEKRILKKLAPVIKSVNAVIFSDYDKGLLTEGLVRGIMKLAGDKIITVDPKPTNIDIFRDITMISPNKKEAAEASGIKIENESDVLEASKILQGITNAKAILITRGEEGMSLWHEGIMESIPTVAREVYDVTGAGDTVIAVATLALAAGAGLKEACALSNIAAGEVVAEVGVVTLTPKELIEAVNVQK
ncbi:MAG: D-glycero-beta-D-manno-heptose-7-phosphate kinase [Spirochaetia bacterium]|nr:D-glycero-beta-D-manno-heptose-7-phosphate kinase [Spirochaetia bacterium]